MNKYNEHVKESIDYFNHESECMKHRVCNCDMQTSLRVGREKTAYETAVVERLRAGTKKLQMGISTQLVVVHMQ